jgi:hypothetical protein
VTRLSPRPANLGQTVGVVRLAVIVAAALTLAGVAAGGTTDHNQVKLTAADQTTAKREVIRLTDLGTGWKGGTVKPDLNDALVCANYHPKQSDLVLTGAAESKYAVTGAQLDSVAQIFRGADMVNLDWHRSVLNPQLVSCLKETLTGNLSSSQTIESVGRVPFPQGHGVLAREYRTVLNVSSNGSTTQGVVDLIVFTRGRSELSLTTVGSYADRAAIARVERVLVGLMLTRATA